MNMSAIADELDQITGSWKPSAAATLDDLTVARKILADALLSGFTTSSLHGQTVFQTKTVTGEIDTIDKIVESSSAQAVPTQRPTVRSVTNIDPKLMADVAGMKVEKSLGPFADSLGVLHWIDLIPIPTKIPIHSATLGDIGFLIVDDPTTGVLNAGSLWIAASALKIPSLTAGAVGLSFSSGVVKTAGLVTVTKSGVTIGAGGSITLTLTLQPPAAAPGTPPFGPDARAMTLNLPTHATVVFAEEGVGVTAVDNSSATVYGTSFSLTRNAQSPHVSVLGFEYVVYPCNASISEFDFTTVASTDIIPSGKAGVIGGGWALPITTATPAQLGAVSSAGAVILQLGPGTQLQFGNLARPTLLGGEVLVLAPGAIEMAATNGPRDLVDALQLWEPAATVADVAPTPAQRVSELDLTVPRGGMLFSTITTDGETIVASGSARANVDRPLAATGQRLPFAFDSTLLEFVHTAAGKLVIVEMSTPAAPAPGAPAVWSIALENGLLIVPPATTAALFADYSGSRLVGSFEFSFTNAQLIPTLPDPYAQGNVTPLPIAGTVSALDTWTLNPGAALKFSVIPPQGTATPAAVRDEDTVRLGRSTLLDLSTNADQFGVVFVPSIPGAVSALSLTGISVSLPQDQLAVYTLPGVSWEPIVDDSTKSFFNASSPDDGQPTFLEAQAVTLVPIEPAVALVDFANAAATVDTRALFTLPFGLTASLNTQGVAAAERPTYALIKADYANAMSAAAQLSITAQSPQPGVKNSTPALPGTVTTGTIVPIPTPVPANWLTYGGQVLFDDPIQPNLTATAFLEQEFSAAGTEQEIPVGRIDISGYGISMFSDWADLNITDVNVVRARFDVLVGRTAYELVQIQTLILPWTVRITKTIIFERFDNGLVVRHDTGWKAVGDAAFEVFTAGELYSGCISKLTNVTNISTVPGNTITAGTKQFVPITFDADVIFQSGASATTPGAVTVTANGVTGKPVPATDILGYAQITTGGAANDVETLQLMQQLPGGVGGTVNCILTVGSQPPPDPTSAQFTIAASSINAKATTVTTGGGYPAAVAIAMFGTPQLPRDGSWSITRRAAGAAAPTAVDPTTPIPLIAGPDASNNPQWRLLDAADALSTATPNTLYGLLQSTGTSKSIFENPVVQAAGQALSLVPAGANPGATGINSLADIASLLGAADIFPALANVLQMPQAVADALNLAKDGFKKTFAWTITKNNDGVTQQPDQTLLDLGVVSLVLQYANPGTSALADVTFTIDATASPRWSLKIDNLALAAFVSGFSSTPILTITGGFYADENTKAGFTNIQVNYGDALSLIKQVLTRIQDVVEAIGGSVNLDVGFSDNKLTVHDGFMLPTMPLGLGQLENIGIDLGMLIDIPNSASFQVGFASQDDPFTWVVDPLAGNGFITLGTDGGELGVFIEAGIGVALELNVAVASGGASIILEFSFDVQPPDVTISIALTGNAFVSVLDGLASASLTLTAGISVEVQPGEADFTGSVAVGIHISICWVISVDFDGSWAFSQSVPLNALP